MLKFEFNNTEKERNYIRKYLENRVNFEITENELNAIANDLQNTEDPYNEIFENLDEYLESQIKNCC